LHRVYRGLGVMCIVMLHWVYRGLGVMCIVMLA
jgi:hypothetical protein